MTSKLNYPLIWYKVQKRHYGSGLWHTYKIYRPEYPTKFIKHKFLWWEWKEEFTPYYEHIDQRIYAIQHARELYEGGLVKTDVRVFRVERKKFMNDTSDFEYLIWMNDKFYDN